MENKKEKKISIKSILELVIPLALSIIIFYSLYKDEDWSVLMNCIKGSKIGWLLLPVAIGLFSHFLRAIRWKMLIKASGMNAKLDNIFHSVMIGYFANFLFPRAGEVARCGVLKKSDGISFTTLIGTVITERLFDMIVTALIILITILLQYQYFASTLSTIDLGSKIMNMLPFIIIFVVIIASVGTFFYKKRNESKLYDKGRETLKKIGKGFASFKDVDNKVLFLTLSLLIFFCYFMMLYVSFWAFDVTKDLSISAGLVVYVMGALGIIAPVQGGIGAWHYLTITALSFYFIPETEAKAFALATHTVQTVIVYVGFGLLSYIIMSIKGHKGKIKD